jgi:dihydroorotate dehydrogenase electron transfer subunit
MPHLTPNPDYRLNKPFMTPIIEITQENSKVKSFRVKYNPIPGEVQIHPGQFVMVWVPGVDEIPMSVSRVLPEHEITITVAAVGNATEALHTLSIDSLIGIRGPYGNWYSPRSGTAIIIGGGIGMASVLPLFYQLLDFQHEETSGKPDQIIFIEGARTDGELMYTEEIANLVARENGLELCTDDGSCGFHGYVTDKFEEVLKAKIEKQQAISTKSLLTVYSCGPEIMLKKVFDICEKYRVDLQVSLERMMRCGFGICGLCALEPTGLLVCKDGPIFTNDQLRQTTDFGKYHRDFSGKPFPL